MEREFESSETRRSTYLHILSDNRCDWGADIRGYCTRPKGHPGEHRDKAGVFTERNVIDINHVLEAERVRKEIENQPEIASGEPMSWAEAKLRYMGMDSETRRDRMDNYLAARLKWMKDVYIWNRMYKGSDSEITAALSPVESGGPTLRPWDIWRFVEPQLFDSGMYVISPRRNDTNILQTSDDADWLNQYHEKKWGLSRIPMVTKALNKSAMMAVMLRVNAQLEPLWAGVYGRGSGNVLHRGLEDFRLMQQVFWNRRDTEGTSLTDEAWDEERVDLMGRIERYSTMWNDTNYQRRGGVSA